MIMVPAAGIYIWTAIGSMIDSYKHAKFLDKVKGTNLHVKNETRTILMVIWAIIAGMLIFTACILVGFSTRT